MERGEPGSGEVWRRRLRRALAGVAGVVLAGTSPVPSAAASDTAGDATGDTAELLPVGAVWSELMVDSSAGGPVIAVAHVNGRSWMLAGRENTARVLRENDDGEFDEILLAPPPDTGMLRVERLLARDDGTLLAYGERGTNCDESPRDAAGYRRVTVCTRGRPVVFVSDDGGDSWRLTEPDGLAPPRDETKLRLVDVVHDGTQYVAAGTVLGPDWHVRLYTSPDGEEWTLRRELRDPRGPLHAVRLLFDGSTYLLHTDASPCSEPRDAAVFAGGWVRGSQWAEHAVLYVGTDLDGLDVLDPAVASIMPLPMEVDCAVTDGFAISREPYPRLQSELAAGHITLRDASSEAAGGDPTVHRVARLVDGTWEELVVERGVGPDGEPREPSVRTPLLGEIDGRLAIVELQRDPLRREGAVLPHLYVHRGGGGDDGGGEWQVVTAVAPLVLFELTGLTWHDDALIAGGYVRARDDDGTFADLPGMWRSTVSAVDPSRCELVAGAGCSGLDLTVAAAELDFGGRDLTGIDLSHAQLSTANFDGAILRSANLFAAQMEFGGSLAGADLTGADLRDATLYGLVDVDLTGVDARGAGLSFVGQPRSWDGAVFEGGSLGFWAWPEPRAVSLAGADLTGTYVAGIGPDDVPLMRVTDLTGATLRGTSFLSVDLTGLDIAPEALAEISFSDASTCPDGQPPTGEGRFGLTCVRD